MSKPHNVYVDLDGTLTPSDVLLESCLLLMRKNPLYVVLMVYWALQGALCLKREVAARVDPDLNHLPIHPEVLDRLTALKAEGHVLVLASASWHRDVSKVAQRLGIFSRVLSTTTENLKGIRKLKVIQEDAQGRPFVYFGDSAADLPIWQVAQRALAVNAAQSVHASAKKQGIILERLDTPCLGFSAWKRAIRLQQWAKNILLFLPLMAAHSVDWMLWGRMLMGFLAFGAVASATYLWNDLMDLTSDRQHPRKRTRPLASGLMSIQQGFLGMLVLGGGGGLLAFFGVNAQLGCMLVLYTCVTLLYTFVFKRMVLMDVVVLAMLYTLRVVAGGLTTGIELSSWLLAISLFLFLSLALVKRCAELELSILDGGQARGRGYRVSDLAYLVPMGIASGFVSVLVLALYVDSQNGSRLYGTPVYLWAICPLFMYWLMRLWILTARKEMIDDPVHFTVRDPVSWGVMLTSAILVFFAI